MSAIIEPAFIENDDLISIGSIDDLCLDEIFADNDDDDDDHQTAHFLSSSFWKAAPRLISVETNIQELSELSRVQTKTHTTSSTPYDAVKELVANKQPLSPLFLGRGKRTHGGGGLSSVVASIFDEPTDAFLAATCNKKPKLSHPLHEACRAHDGNILAALSSHPSAAAQSIRLFTTKRCFDHLSCQFQSQYVGEKYTYPLNLAIETNADSQAIESLVVAAPAVLMMPDGPLEESSLHILLRHKPHDHETCDMMLLKDPSVAAFKDRHLNTPLHAACASGACLSIVKLLYNLYPDALVQRNFHGLTPLQLCQQRGMCSEEVASFMWEAVQKRF